MENGSFKLAFLVVLLVVETSGLGFGVQARDAEDHSQYPNKGPIVRFPCKNDSQCPSGCSCKNTMCKCAADDGALKSVSQELSPPQQAQPQRGYIYRVPCSVSTECREGPPNCNCINGFCQCNH